MGQWDQRGCGWEDAGKTREYYKKNGGGKKSTTTPHRAPLSDGWCLIGEFCTVISASRTAVVSRVSNFKTMNLDVKSWRQ
jgi:hypothetical protein